MLSHPQALAQCRSFLQQKLSGARTVECPSTVTAAGQVAGQDRPWVALAPLTAAAEYGLTVLVAEANDYPGSVTRFWVVGGSRWPAPEPAPRHPSSSASMTGPALCTIFSGSLPGAAST